MLHVFTSVSVFDVRQLFSYQTEGHLSRCECEFNSALLLRERGHDFSTAVTNIATMIWIGHMSNTNITVLQTSHLNKV